MSLRITANASSFAQNNIGWKSPTKSAPKFAAFFDGTIKNVANATQPSAINGISLPKATPGTLGKELPYITTQGGSAGFNSNVPQSGAMTFAALLRTDNPTNGSQYGLLASTWQLGGARNLQLITQGDVWHVFGMPPGSGGEYFNAKAVGWGKWVLMTFTLDFTTSSNVMVCSDLTNGLTDPHTENGPIDTGAGPSVWIGHDPTSSPSANAGKIDLAFLGIWDKVLPQDDQQSLHAFLQNYAARYGQVV